MPAFIDDGYSETKEIPKGRDYEAVSVTVRPMAAGELAEFRMKLNNAGDDLAKQNQVIADVLAGHLVSWNVKDLKGAVVPVTPVNVLKLNNDLFLEIYLRINPPADAKTEPPEKNS